jgi:peptidoglycan-N-acetylglucosamine deacetylase
MLDLKLRLVSILIGLTIVVIVCLILDYFRLLRRPWRIGLYTGILGIVGAAILTTNAVLPTSLFYGIVAYQGPQSEKLVALTFDDGPNPPYTLQVLDILDKYDVEATFFLIGKNVEAHPEVAREIVERGHQIGNHSFTHPDLLKLSGAQIAQEIDTTTKIIETETGVRPKIFRPPHGFRDPIVLAKAKERNLTVVEWSVMARDWKNPGAEVIADRIVKKIHNGAIILLHDGDGIVKGGDRSQSVAATEIVIQRLQRDGYRFVRIDELLVGNKIQ